MKPDRAWVRLGSGRRLDLVNPQAASWHDSDLAIGLSRTYRWGGHSRWDRPLTVAQHSLLVLVLRQHMQPHQPLTPGEALRELLHDGEEFIGFDPIAPLKPHLGDEHGQWVLDGKFTVFTTDEELVTVAGWACTVEIQ